MKVIATMQVKWQNYTSICPQNIHTEFQIYHPVFDKIQIKVNYNQLNIKSLLIFLAALLLINYQMLKNQYFGADKTQSKGEVSCIL